MAILGGSPLGLINVKSIPLNGRSTFNDGASRGVSVAAYNSGAWNAGMRGNSLFSGSRVVRAWPNASAFNDPDRSSQPGTGNSSIDDVAIKKARAEGTQNATPQGNYKQRKSLHNNDVYDVSILNIIEHLATTRGSLKMADFAYLKDVGVYPNNRLMIARKFGTAVTDNIISPRKKSATGKFTESGAQATLISWVPETQDYLKITFGEEWVDADGDFKEIFNRIGADVMGGKMGDIMGKLGNVIPLPGFTEGFQRQMLEKMGFIEGAGNIPSGNPNLIKEAKRRKTIPKEQAGSSLSCKVDIEMNCEYEQKFISGIDPTIVWMDIIGMIARFGTSPSSFYGLSGNLAAKINKWLNDPMSMVNDALKALKQGLVWMASKISKAVNKFIQEGREAIRKRQEDRDADEELDDIEDEEDREEAEEEKELEEQTKADEKENKLLDKFQAMGNKVLSFIGNFLKTGLDTLAKKYKIEIQGVVNALSGAASTPWHISIGNPLRPVFCAGDMYTQTVTITLGPTLAFNDLPASIKAGFTLTNARPWGLQEIMAKFNSGYLRTLDAEKSYYEIEVDALGNIEPLGGFSWEGVYVDPATLSSMGVGGSNGVGGAQGSQGSQGSQGTSATGSQGALGSQGVGAVDSKVKEDTKGTGGKKAATKTSKTVNGKKDKGKKK